jgi:hypothetical protein
MLDLEAVQKRLDAARDELSALCKGKRFLMTIPPDRNRDSDLILAATLSDIPALQAELATAHAALEDKHRAWLAAERELDAARAALGGLLTACEAADAQEDLSELVDGSLMDAAREALDAARRAE